MNKNKTKRKLPKWLRFILDKFWFILAGLALALGLAYTIKGCTMKGAKAFYESPKKALQAGDIVTPVNNYPVTNCITVVDSNDSTDYHYKAITSYITVNLQFDGVNSQNVNSYSYESIEINVVVTGDSNTQWTLKNTFYNYRGLSLNNNYLYLDSYCGWFSGEDAEISIALFNTNPVSNTAIVGSSRQYDYLIAGSSYTWTDDYNGDHTDDLNSFLASYNTDNGVEYYELPNNDSGDVYLMLFCIEEERLIMLADAYNAGYMAGYLNGINAVTTNPHAYDLYTDNDISQAYDRGYSQGTLDAEGASIPTLIYTIFNAPSAILNGAFGFEIFGVNVANLIKFGLTVGAVIFIVGWLKRK